MAEAGELHREFVCFLLADDGGESLLLKRWRID